MTTYTEYLWFNTDKRRDLIRITPSLEAILGKSGVREGLMLVSAMHITAGIIVNDDEQGLHRDIMSGSHRRTRPTSTTGRARTTATRTSNESSSIIRPSSRSRRGASTSALGNSAFTQNSTAGGENASSSK